MRGGFRTMIGAPVRADEIDLEATRVYRQAVHEAVRRRSMRLASALSEPIEIDTENGDMSSEAS